MRSGPSGSARARSTLTFLRSRISSGEWPVNSRIPKEPELMEMIGVGKSTVREAVRSLANLGMLETIPGIGTFVRSRTPASSLLTDYLADYDLDEILVYRHALEVEAAQQAARHRSHEQLAVLRACHESDRERGTDVPRTIERGITPGSFHHLIFEATGSRLLPGTYTAVMSALRRAMDRGRVVHGSCHTLRHMEHEAILSAIADGDVARAAHAMAQHADRDLVPVVAGSVEPVRVGSAPAD